MNDTTILAHNQHGVGGSHLDFMTHGVRCFLSISSRMAIQPIHVDGFHSVSLVI
jgi:hypothetical protein